MPELIEVLRDGVIATVVLNRPEKLNALTKGMWQALGAAIDTLSADDSLRCVILRGAGEKAFSPGNDIAEFATERANKPQAIAYGHLMHATLHALAACRHPLVAQIHGICVGGGLEIAALCDLRICGESSRFGAPIKNLGLTMAYPEMAPLVHLVGSSVALEILLGVSDEIERWSLTTLREKVVKIGAKVISHGRYLVSQMAEVAVPRELFGRILDRIARLRPPDLVPC